MCNLGFFGFFVFLVFWFLGFLVFACPTSFAIPLPGLRLIRSCFARASHPVRSVTMAVPNDDLSLSAAIDAQQTSTAVHGVGTSPMCGRLRCRCTGIFGRVGGTGKCGRIERYIYIFNRIVILPDLADIDLHYSGS